MSIFQGRSTAWVKFPNKAKPRTLPPSLGATYLDVAAEPAGSTLPPAPEFDGQLLPAARPANPRPSPGANFLEPR
jgi:hypothetical protein